MAVGGDQQHGWSVKKNERNRMEDATDTTGNFFAVYDGHGGTEAVRFVKKELPKPLGKERDPNPCERLRQAFDKANKALSEHFQKKGESNSDYGYCHLALAPVLLFTRGFSGQPWRLSRALLQRRRTRGPHYNDHKLGVQPFFCANHFGDTLGVQPFSF